MELARAKTFLLRHARVLERRVFACCFENGSTDGVRAALRAYRNPDGGFGHALEPDLRTSASQPIFVDVGLGSMHEADAFDEELALGACDFLGSVATPEGAVSPTLPGAEDDPCAGHWKLLSWAHTPGVNPTARIAGHLHAFGVHHPWLDRATTWCIAQIENEDFESGHTLLAALTLAEHLPDRERGHELVERIMRQVPAAEWFLAEVPVESYGLTPLHFAPTPAAPARRFFDDNMIEAHLNDLAAHQEEDGGWPIHWEAPGRTAMLSWRARWTLEALRTLHAYGRL